MLTITIYNLSIKIETNEQKLHDFIGKFIARNYTSRQAGQGNNPALEKRFSSEVGSPKVYYLHTNQFIHMLHDLRPHGFDISHAERVDKRDYEHVDVDYKVRPGWSLRDYQEPICDFLTTNPKGSRMVSLQPGGGKTLISMYSLAKVGMRLGILILPNYIDKWLGDIVKIHDACAKDIMVIQGSKSVRAIVAMAKDGEIDAKYFVFSSRTMQEFITSYEENPEQTELLYGTTPVEIFPLLKIGSLLIDETHQQFHAIFKILVHTNVKYHVGLSATLLSDDAVVTKVHKVVYPTKNIYEEKEIVKYTNVYALTYSIPDTFIRAVKTSNYGMKSYSHTAFEQSMLKLPPMRKFYLSLIDNALDDFYIDRYEPNDKCVVFVGTVKLATMLAERYTELHPDKVVKRYCEDDPFEHLESGDIIISTVNSAGTAVDIANLRVVIQTVSISSTPSNIQVLGRLRKLDGDRDTRFCYLYADNIRKQSQYHYRRIDLFRDRVATHQTFRARANM